MAKTFSIQINTEPEVLIAKAKQTASQHGAIFNGDSLFGNFRGHGVAGEYKIEGETMHITISEKPFIAPWPMVESTVKAFFS